MVWSKNIECLKQFGLEVARSPVVSESFQSFSRIGMLFALVLCICDSVAFAEHDSEVAHKRALRRHAKLDRNAQGLKPTLNYSEARLVSLSTLAEHSRLLSGGELETMLLRWGISTDETEELSDQVNVKWKQNLTGSAVRAALSYVEITRLSSGDLIHIPVIEPWLESDFFGDPYFEYRLKFDQLGSDQFLSDKEILTCTYAILRDGSKTGVGVRQVGDHQYIKLGLDDEFRLVIDEDHIHAVRLREIDTELKAIRRTRTDPEKTWKKNKDMEDKAIRLAIEAKLLLEPLSTDWTSWSIAGGIVVAGAIAGESSLFVDSILLGLAPEALSLISGLTVILGRNPAFFRGLSPEQRFRRSVIFSMFSTIPSGLLADYVTSHPYIIQQGMVDEYSIYASLVLSAAGFVHGLTKILTPEQLSLAMRNRFSAISDHLRTGLHSGIDESVRIVSSIKEQRSLSRQTKEYETDLSELQATIDRLSKIDKPKL